MLWPPTASRPHLGQQFRVAVQHFQQLDQRQRGLGFAGFVAREGVDAAAKYFGGLALVEGEFFAHLGDVAGGDEGGVDLLVVSFKEL